MSAIYAVQRTTDLGSVECQEYLRTNRRSKRGFRMRKYSILQLDQSVKHAATHGFAAAQEVTGVSVHSIKKHALSIKRRGKDSAQVAREFVGRKYEARQLTYAIERAIKMQRAGAGSMNKCLEKAAGLCGVSYAYLRVIYSKELVPFNTNP